MSTNEKKVIKHRILDKHPIVGIILLTVLALFMIQGFIGGVLGVGIALVLGLPQEPILYISMTISAFIMLAIHKRWFYPEYEGSFSFDNRFGKWLIVTIAILLALIIPDFIIMTVTGKTDIPAWGCIFNTLVFMLLMLPSKLPAKGNIAGALMYLGLIFLI